eukprot:scaffold195407_cov27-Prasinocladus_malaysianus.AAC.2
MDTVTRMMNGHTQTQWRKKHLRAEIIKFVGIVDSSIRRTSTRTHPRLRLAVFAVAFIGAYTQHPTTQRHNKTEVFVPGIIRHPGSGQRYIE